MSRRPKNKKMTSEEIRRKGLSSEKFRTTRTKVKYMQGDLNVKEI
jgi:hypothetical protein